MARAAMAARIARAAVLLALGGVAGGVQVGRLKAKSFRSIAVPYHVILAPHEAVTSLPANLTVGNLLAYEPHQPVTSDLFVFLPGSKSPCDSYSQLMETIGREMSSICLPYDNRQFVAELCGADSWCYPDFRLSAYNGSFLHVEGNNIESRLASALAYLSVHDGGGRWASFLDPSTHLPRWSGIRLAGHSQGAGNAALIGYFRKVARVVQLAGVCDRSDWTSRLGQPATPSDRFFGMASRYDTQVCNVETQVHSWQAEGAVMPQRLPLIIGGDPQTFTTVDLGGSQTVITNILSDGCSANFTTSCAWQVHASVAQDWPGGSPYARGVWQALVGV